MLTFCQQLLLLYVPVSPVEVHYSHAFVIYDSRMPTQLICNSLGKET